LKDGGTRFDQPPTQSENVEMPRFILLEHTGAPDDPVGRHYDLLLEAGEACLTWRLTAIPSVGGPAVAAVEITPHRLAWLDHEAGEVSGGRGFARRIDGGTYEPALEGNAEDAPPECIHVRLVGGTSTQSLRLVRVTEGWTARIDPGKDPGKGASHLIWG
jgi:hypothetical protein